jgi:hypothetical protein
MASYGVAPLGVASHRQAAFGRAGHGKEIC